MEANFPNPEISPGELGNAVFNQTSLGKKAAACKTEGFRTLPPYDRDAQLFGLRDRRSPAYQGLSFHPRMKPMPKHHSAAISGRSRAYSRA